MRALAALCVIALPACTVVFPLEAGDNPESCIHEGLLLCLAFEDDPTDGTADDFSGRNLDATTAEVTSIERAPGEKGIAVTMTSSVVIQGSEADPGNTALDLPTPVSFDLWMLYGGVLPTTQVALDNEFQYGVQIPEIGRFPATPEMIGCHWVFPTGPAPEQIAFREINAIATPNVWHHIACVYDGATLHMYTNSVEIPQQATGPLNDRSTNFLNVGRSGTPTDPRNMIGFLDNVRIWNRALSSEEVRLIFMGSEDLVP